MNPLINGIETLLYHAKKGVQYEHHYSFLSICLDNEIVRKELRIRKTACIYDTTEDFQRRWREEENKGGKEFTRLLGQENLRKTIKHQSIFWDLAIKIMATNSIFQVRECFLSVMDIVNFQTNYNEYKRTRKLTRLIPSYVPERYQFLNNFSLDILSVCRILFE